jgi:hypothetical protein
MLLLSVIWWEEYPTLPPESTLEENPLYRTNYKEPTPNHSGDRVHQLEAYKTNSVKISRRTVS